MVESARKKFGAMLLSLALFLPLQVNGSAERLLPEEYLLRQATALQAAYRHHLDFLSEAPFYRINAQIDMQSSKVEGELILRYTNTTGQPLSELVFRLLPNAKRIYGGALSLASVSQDGMVLDVQQSADHTVLRVPLLETLAPDHEATLTIDFVTELPVNGGQGYGILNHTSHFTSLAGWYPILAVYRNGWQTPDLPSVGDGLVAETSLYEVTLAAPNGSRVVSTGRVTGVENTGAGRVWQMVSGPAREFAVAISDQFETRQTMVDGVTVRFHSLPASRPRTSPNDALAMVRAAFEVYIDRFGPYPLTELDIVDGPIPIGGYEFPGMVYVDHGTRARGAPADYRYLVAHEIAHQWWYGLVGNDAISEPWLDEALASYSASLFEEQTQGASSGDGLRAYWQRTYGHRLAPAPAVNSPASRFTNWVAYRSPVYYQGALFLDALRGAIGDAAFFRLLRRYVLAFRYHSATTMDFLSLAQETACRDLEPLIAQWFDGYKVDNNCSSSCRDAPGLSLWIPWPPSSQTACVQWGILATVRPTSSPVIAPPLSYRPVISWKDH